MNLANKALALLEETRIIILKGDERFICYRCKKDKHFAEFHPSQIAKTNPRCRLCINKISRKNYQLKKVVPVQEYSLLKAGLHMAGINADKLIDKAKKVLGSIFTIKYVEGGENKYTTSTGKNKSDASSKFKSKHPSAKIVWIK